MPWYWCKHNLTSKVKSGFIRAAVILCCVYCAAHHKSKVLKPLLWVGWLIYILRLKVTVFVGAVLFTAFWLMLRGPSSTHTCRKNALRSNKSNLHHLSGAADIREGFLLFLPFTLRRYTCSWPGHIINSYWLSFGATAVQQWGHHVGKLA